MAVCNRLFETILESCIILVFRSLPCGKAQAIFWRIWMSIYSKLFGKKKTVDTSTQAANHQQARQAAAVNGPNAQAQMYNDFVVYNEPGDGAQVAEVYLNVDTESKSRSHMTMGELIKGNVGHTWLTIKPLNGQLPDDLNAMVQTSTRNLIDSFGETAMGFWPLEVREKRTEGKKISEEKAAKNAEENARQNAEMEIRQAKGMTYGSGSIYREDEPNYDLHSIMSGRDTAGRVEEPDDTHSPKGRKVYRITRKQFRDMYRYIDAHRNHKYNLLSYNCTTFAAHALKAAGQTVQMEGKTMPTSLYEAMYKEAKAHEKAAERAKRRRQAQPAKSGVELLKLEEGEAHRKKGKDKEGPDGKKVRVKGVDKFDMTMFTDQAEISLRKAADAEEITPEMKSEFAQLLFRESHKRTLDAAKAYTDEAVKIHLMTKDEAKNVVDFYQNGFNVLEDPTPITTHPEFFLKYMMDIYEAMPNEETFSYLMDGSSLSPKHNAIALTKQLMWTIISSDKEVGNGYEAFVEPLTEIAFIGPIMPGIIDGVVEAIKHHNRYESANLLQLQYLINHFFLDTSENNNKIREAAKDYLKVYFNKRIKAHTVTQQTYNDAVTFANETGMTEIMTPWFPIIERAREASRRYNVHSTIFSKDGTALSTLPKDYRKAQIEPRPSSRNAHRQLPKPDENEIVAEVFLNVDVSPTKVAEGKNVSRSNLTMDVGHTWLTIKANPQNGQPGGLPNDIEAEMEKTETGKNSVNIMRAKGETAVGFYPLQNSFLYAEKKKYHKKSTEESRQKDDERALTTQAMMDLRRNKGFTRGDGDVARNQREYKGFSFLHGVAGRVEEPDDAHSPKGRKSFLITRKLFKKMYAYIDSHRNHKYNLKTYNCTTFASHALREAGYHVSGSRMGICYPAKLYREMYDEAKKDARHNLHSDVKLLRLAENESHGKFKAGKTGNGPNVRVKGVSKFDMVENYIDPVELQIKKMELKENPDALDTIALISRMLSSIPSRSAAEGTHLINEAAHLGFVTPKQQANLIYLTEHFRQLKSPIEDYINLPMPQVYDFLKHVSDCIPKDVFKETFEEHFQILTSKTIRGNLPGSANFEAGINTIFLFSDVNFAEFFKKSIESVPLTKEIVQSTIALFTSFVFTELFWILDLIKKFNGNDPTETFKFIAETFREPFADAQYKATLYSFLGNIMSEQINIEAASAILKTLKDEGHINEQNHDLLLRQLHQKK